MNITKNTTTNTIDLTPEQLIKILTNAYGLLDEHGELFSTNEHSFDLENEEVELYSIERNSVIISMNGATVNGSTLSVFFPDYTEAEEELKVEAFTLLAKVNGEDLLN